MRAPVVLLVVAACSSKGAVQSTPPPRGPVLYDRIGRMDVIKDIVRDFVARGLMTGPLAARFSNVDVARLEEGLVTQLCEVSGGPCKYTGRPMREAHAGLAIADADFTAFLAALREALARHRVGRREQDELVGELSELRDQIVMP